VQDAAATSQDKKADPTGLINQLAAVKLAPEVGDTLAPSADGRTRRGALERSKALDLAVFDHITEENKLLDPADVVDQSDIDQK
jgi:hypothetical protein